MYIRYDIRNIKGTLQRELRGVKIGINRFLMMYSLAGKCPVPCSKRHHHERSINVISGFSTFLRHPNWLGQYTVQTVAADLRRGEHIPGGGRLDAVPCRAVPRGAWPGPAFCTTAVDLSCRSKSAASSKKTMGARTAFQSATLLTAPRLPCDIIHSWHNL